MRGSLRRDEAGVSAAVATVLLFGGVLSIIGLMMVSMMPVIEEMEGSVERHDMSSQMELLARRPLCSASEACLETQRTLRSSPSTGSWSGTVYRWYVVLRNLG